MLAGKIQILFQISAIQLSVWESNQPLSGRSNFCNTDEARRSATAKSIPIGGCRC
ncbi:MAG: hypothetical protein ACM65K_22485 [Microcoleus sp.]